MAQHSLALKEEAKTGSEVTLGAREALQESFARFAEASSRLEGKYADLVAETEFLRAEIRRKDDTIKRSERLATLGETAAGIAHEIRNPLGAMKLFTSLLRREVGEIPTATELVHELDRSIISLDNVVSNILQFAKKTSPLRLGPINLSAIIHELVAHFKLMSGDKVEYAVSVPLASYIQGDEHALRQAFYNIFLNAHQAMRYEGRLEIKLSPVGDKQFKLNIQDSGPGIPVDILPRIFEPFVTAKNEGTGLGLAIVQRVIDELGGKISARNICKTDNSDSVTGAVFELILPIRAQQKAVER